MFYASIRSAAVRFPLIFAIILSSYAWYCSLNISIAFSSSAIPWSTSRAMMAEPTRHDRFPVALAAFATTIVPEKRLEIRSCNHCHTASTGSASISVITFTLCRNVSSISCSVSSSLTSPRVAATIASHSICTSAGVCGLAANFSARVAMFERLRGAIGDHYRFRNVTN